jgi:glycosyltransferase involved in cell wall biosynthesis
MNSSRRHICLVSTGHLSTNPRLVKEAQALTGAGYRVTIVHGDYLPDGLVTDRLIADPDWTVVPVPFGRRRTVLSAHIRQRGMMAAADRLLALGFRTAHLTEAAHAPITRDLIAATKGVARADLYIAHYPAALAAAARAARHHRAVYAFDAEDFHLGDLPDLPEHAFDKAKIRAIEARYLPGAAYVTAASPMIAEAYAETYGIPLPTTILNVFPRAHAPAAPTPRGTTTPGPSLYWFSQTIGPGRGLEIALEAISFAKTKPHLYLRGIPAAGYDITLRKAAAAFGVAERLHFVSPISPLDLERAGSAYDIGYVGEQPHTQNRKIALTNKLFSYMSSGLPIIASDIPAHHELFRHHPEFIRCFSDAKTLAYEIDSIMTNVAFFSKARNSAYAEMTTSLNWEIEQKTFLQKVTLSYGTR